MQDIFEQDGFKGDVRAHRIRRENVSVINRSGYNELRRSVERSKVLIEVVLLSTGLAGRRRPKLNRVRGDVHVDQASATSNHQYEAAQQDH